MSLGLTPPQIRNRLLIFSIAAPAGAILTYLAVRLFGASQHVKAHHVDPLQWWTGAVLLFSVSRHFFCGLVWHSLQGSLTSLSDQGGSFLYVATVISPLSDSDSHHTHAHASHTHPSGMEKLTQYQRLALLLAGMLLPLLLSAFIGHEH